MSCGAIADFDVSAPYFDTTHTSTMTSGGQTFQLAAPLDASVLAAAGTYVRSVRTPLDVAVYEADAAEKYEADYRASIDLHTAPKDEASSSSAMAESYRGGAMVQLRSAAHEMATLSALLAVTTPIASSTSRQVASGLSTKVPGLPDQLFDIVAIAARPYAMSAGHDALGSAISKKVTSVANAGQAMFVEADRLRASSAANRGYSNQLSQLISSGWRVLTAEVSAAAVNSVDTEDATSALQQQQQHRPFVPMGRVPHVLCLPPAYYRAAAGGAMDAARSSPLPAIRLLAPLLAGAQAQRVLAGQGASAPSSGMGNGVAVGPPAGHRDVQLSVRVYPPCQQSLAAPVPASAVVSINTTTDTEAPGSAGGGDSGRVRTGLDLATACTRYASAAAAELAMIALCRQGSALATGARGGQALDTPGQTASTGFAKCSSTSVPDRPGKRSRVWEHQEGDIDAGGGGDGHASARVQLATVRVIPGQVAMEVTLAPAAGGGAARIAAVNIRVTVVVALLQKDRDVILPDSCSHPQLPPAAFSSLASSLASWLGKLISEGPLPSPGAHLRTAASGDHAQAPAHVEAAPTLLAMLRMIAASSSQQPVDRSAAFPQCDSESSAS